jgi:hypothetical protein
MPKGNPNPKRSPETEFKPGHEKSVSHGVYAYRRSGDIPEARQTPEVTARIQELRENLATVEGMEKEQENLTEVAIGSLELALSWVREKREDGLGLDDIKIFRQVPALINAAGRQLSQLMDVKDRLGKVDAMIADYEELIGDSE